MRQSELKQKYDPELGRYVKKHIYGEGLMDKPKAIYSEVLKKTTKKAAGKVGDYVVKKAGDKIIELLSKKQPVVQTPMSDIADRVNQLISAGKYKK